MFDLKNLSRKTLRRIFPTLTVEVDRYIGRYLGFTNVSVSAKTAGFIGLSSCCQNAVMFLTHPENLRKKTQRGKSRQFILRSMNGRYIGIGPKKATPVDL